MDPKKHLFELTPLGKAHKEVKNYLEHRVEDHQLERYESSLKHYRRLKVVQTGLKTLFYASIITSVAATLGLDEAKVLQKIASYVGTSLLFALYAATSYFTMIRRESYHVQREILISQAAGKDSSGSPLS